jgi:hypothetical protein
MHSPSASAPADRATTVRSSGGTWKVTHSVTPAVLATTTRRKSSTSVVDRCSGF